MKGKSYKVIIKLIRKIDEEKAEQRAWEMWLVKYPRMTKKTFVNFNDFYKKVDIKIEKKSQEEILKDVYEIREKLTRK